jgi:NADH dehydrogenase
LLAKNLTKSRDLSRWAPFRYVDKGAMATIGKNKAVVELGKIRFSGPFAWLVWVFVHIMALVEFRNRFLVFVSWSWSYVSSDKSIRLIIRPYKKQLSKEKNL